MRANNNRYLKPARAGEVRNPKGRGKGTLNTKTRLERIMKLQYSGRNPLTGEVDTISVAEIIDLALIAKAAQGDVSAYREIADRIDGKVKTSIDINSIENEQKRVGKLFEDLERQIDEQIAAENANNASL